VDSSACGDPPEIPGINRHFLNSREGTENSRPDNRRFEFPEMLGEAPGRPRKEYRARGNKAGLDRYFIVWRGQKEQLTNADTKTT
jgi:hypothetical protein